MISEPITEADREGADPGLLIESATREVHDARKRHRREIVERTRLRRLVERVDSAIELCEETHLQGIKEVPPEVAVRARKVFTFARGAVRKTGNAETIQEIVFDLMLPWRTELPEDVEVEGDEMAIGAGFWREFRLRP